MNNYYDIETYIKQVNSLLAHTKTGEDPETLYEHMDRTKTYFEMIFHQYGMKEILAKAIDEIRLVSSEEEGYKAFSEEGKALFLKAFINSVYLHDIGKANPAFQGRKMKNRGFTNTSGETKHSMLSTILFFDRMNEELKVIEDEEERYALVDICYLFGSMIAKHHGRLDSLVEFSEKYQRSLQSLFNFKKGFKTHYNMDLDAIKERLDDLFAPYNDVMIDAISQNILPVETLFIVTKLLYSVLIGCDFYATNEYMSGMKVTQDMMGDLQDLVEEAMVGFESSDLFKRIMDYQQFQKKQEKASVNQQKQVWFNKEYPINDLRSAMFLEATEVLVKNKDKHIFYLEAPTGSGKTNTSIYLALKLIKEGSNQNKLFYVFPFNTLVDQSFEKINEVFEGIVHPQILNSITPIPVDEEEETTDYDKAYMNYLFLHYPMIVTTHIRFFDMLFGTSRESNIALSKLANSVVIIDEIQSYNIAIWNEMIYILDKYCHVLNIKIIIMSATLPRLDQLLDKTSASFVNLIKDRNRYFSNPLFKNRVKLDYSLLKKPMIRETGERDYQRLLEHVKEKFLSRKKEYGTCKILVECLTTKSARALYHLFCQEDVFEEESVMIFELTGNDNRAKRKEIINMVKNKSISCILVATQVIEAGVDIDMDIGYKSISFLDAEEQFLGRINRSCLKKECLAYFFDMKEAELVYQEDCRRQFRLDDREVQDFLREKDFCGFYSKVMVKIKEQKQQKNEKNIAHFYDGIRTFNFKKVNELLRLIETKQKIQLVINTRQEVPDEQGNSSEIDGGTVWEDYLTLIHDHTTSFSEKKIKLSRIQAKLDYFTYSIYAKKDKRGLNMEPSGYQSKMGDMYYYSDGERFIEDGQFNIEAAKSLFTDKFTEYDFL